MSEPVTVTINCLPHQTADIQSLWYHAELMLLNAGATNITDVQYRICRDYMVDGFRQPFGIQFTAQADRNI